MFIFYDLIFLLIAVIYFPVYLFKRKLHRGFFLRLGILPPELELENPVWVHAVSVGEAMAIRGLVEKIRQAYPHKKFVISTVTPTGNKIARSIANSQDFVTYLPLDFSFIVNSVMDKVKPSLFIIAETEIWPNLLHCLNKRNIPVAIVNGRISDESFKGYRMIKFLIRPALNKINLFCVQSGTDKERLSDLGVPENKIRVTGNMKFDIKDYIDAKKDYTDLRLKLGLDGEDRLLVSGSTHPGEEKIILDVYKKLLSEFYNLKLLIAPRHPERSAQIINLIKKFGFQAKRVSLLNEPTHQERSEAKPPRRGRTKSEAKRSLPEGDEPTIFLLDTIGQLKDFYAIADIVFVGGSLVKVGGHNILEPALFGKPVLFGPYMFNFRDVADLFLKDNAAILVRNQEELYEKIRGLLNNITGITEISERAKALIADNQGATQRNLERIQRIFNAKI